MHDLFLWLEMRQFSIFVRESGSLWAFPTFLFLHTLGMSIVAGGATVINLAVLGVWPRATPLKPLERFYPLLWLGFAINLITGLSMFMKDATTLGYNPDFYVKILLVMTGALLLVVMRRRVFDDPRLDRGPLPPAARRLAWASLLCWFGAIIAGRLLAYVGPVAGL